MCIQVERPDQFTSCLFFRHRYRWDQLLYLVLSGVMPVILSSVPMGSAGISRVMPVIPSSVIMGTAVISRGIWWSRAI